jgi:D,D-heptose 1,7-bisphosphate phosphatase
MSNKAVFLDRDDTLIEDLGYINHPDQVKLLDGVVEAMQELRAIGYKLVVVSNQSAVARGIVTEKVLGEIHDRLNKLLAEKGISLDGIYYCPYHPDGAIPKYRKESDLRKPNPGMLLTAAEQMHIDLSQSWMIGNSNRDIEAGTRAGCKTILINHPSQNKQHAPYEPNPEYKAVNLREAVIIIKKCHRHSVETMTPEQSSLGEQAQTVGTSAEQSDRPKPVHSTLFEQKIHSQSSEWLLSSILEQLKSMQRAEMFGEFSIMRLLAGIVQVITLFCLLISIWLLMGPARQDNSVLIALGFTGVFQLMSLTLYVMQRRK